mmetsp:Transcript_13530/g.53638  ORF Transcript_13530/g.53638 Transcript_13530/m.53638 type:complete len:272 (-) Transcript_13530:1996-2811(-)
MSNASGPDLKRNGPTITAISSTHSPSSLFSPSSPPPPDGPWNASVCRRPTTISRLNLSNTGSFCTTSFSCTMLEEALRKSLKRAKVERGSGSSFSHLKKRPATTAGSSATVSADTLRGSSPSPSFFSSFFSSSFSFFLSSFLSSLFSPFFSPSPFLTFFRFSFFSPAFSPSFLSPALKSAGPPLSIDSFSSSTASNGAKFLVNCAAVNLLSSRNLLHASNSDGVTRVFSVSDCINSSNGTPNTLGFWSSLTMELTVSRQASRSSCLSQRMA